MRFSEVTDIKIPEGNVIKIQESTSGRVLWKKKNQIVDDSFPRMAVFDKYSQIYNSPEYGYYFRACEVGKVNGKRYSSPSGTGGNTYRILKVAPSIDISNIDTSKYLSVGDVFTVKYVNNVNEFNNFPSGAHDVTDAIFINGAIGVGSTSWDNLSSYISQAQPTLTITPSGVSTPYTCKIGNKPTLVSFSSYGACSMRVSSILNDYSEYLTEFEANSGVNYPKSQYPYVKISCLLTVLSPSLRIYLNDFCFVAYINR